VTVTTRYEQLTAHDGGTFEAFCAVPASGTGPGILLFQEIFGINDNMRTLAERLAGAGYVVLVPDMFWRIEPRFERKDESGFADALAVVQRFDADQAPADIQAAHAHLLALPECAGKVGAVGFCLGGTLTFMCAARSRVDGRGIDAAVSYYGSAINERLDLLHAIECPVLFHYGAEDPFIPEEKIAEVEHAIEGHPEMALHRYAAGHAFSNEDTPSMHDATAAAAAWERTLAFFETNLR
jgi:carboxymethylenebutenolidase